MIKVYVTKQTNYPVSTPNIKKDIRKFLVNRGIVSDAELSIAIIGKNRMMDLAKKYLNEKESVHNVLSFTENEINEKFVYPPGVIQLGEVVICYPKAFEEAKVENKRIEEKILELIRHGTLHLLGIHHE